MKSHCTYFTLLFVLSLGLAEAAFAAGGWVTCNTSSNGLSFQHQSRDTGFSRTQAVTQCRKNGSTANVECEVNVWCNDGSAYPQMVACTTFSNGLSFSLQTRSSQLSREGAVSQCRGNGSTNNTECQVNVACNDGSGTARMVQCRTFSNGLHFEKATRSGALSRQEVTGECRSNGSTVNSECEANVACNDGSPTPRLVRCETSSNGLQFTKVTRDRKLSRNEAIGDCRSNGSTTNSECEANLWCNDGGYYPPFVTCSTSSNGLFFSKETRSASLSKNEATGACQSNGSTNNAECEVNIACR